MPSDEVLKLKPTSHWLLLASLALALQACSGGVTRPQATAPVSDVVETSAEIPALTAPETSLPIWIPEPGTTWQWQLTGDLSDSLPSASVYDLDLFETDASAVRALHAQGRKVICYLSAGSWEDWRPDAETFPGEIIGKKYQGWPGERWLDIRRLDALGEILGQRLDLCRAKGFDGIEPDNIDAYANDTGFPLTAADQLTFNRWLASEAHARGLSIGLKNDPDQAAELVADFDWALTEDCYDQGWCGAMLPFLEAGKAVFAAEYTDTGVDFEAACMELQPAGFSLILKDRELTAWSQACEE